MSPLSAPELTAEGLPVGCSDGKVAEDDLTKTLVTGDAETGLDVAPVTTSVDAIVIVELLRISVFHFVTVFTYSVVYHEALS